MAVRKKRSISVSDDLDVGTLVEAARKEFTIRAGLEAVGQFEEEYEPFSPSELAEADQWAAEAVARSQR